MPITKEYISNLIPMGLPDGRVILKEGIALGQTIEKGRTKFLEGTKYKNYMEFWIEQRDAGKIPFSSNIGLATLEEQLDALEELKDWCRANDVNFYAALIIPSINLAIPKELRESSADATSYLMDTIEDYKAHEEIDGVTCISTNQTLFVPNALETTINSVKAGSPFIGTTSQLSWDFPGCYETEKYVTDALKSVGIMASKRKDGLSFIGYPEDGLGGNCTDTVSYAAILMYENYIYNDLCGASMAAGIGGLISDIRYKSALLRVFDQICREEDHPGVMIYHAATTTQWDHDLDTNFGTSCQELLMMILSERYYKTGATIITVPITEKVAVPTLYNIETIMGAASRMEKTAWQWDDVVDFDEIDKLADDIYDKAKIMFNNFMDSLKEAGIDTEDPLQLMMILKKINGALFEETYHPSIKEKGYYEPYYPNDMGLLLIKMTNEAISELEDQGYLDSLQGKRILIGSMDCHIYGMRYVTNVLSRMGAEVVSIGVDCTSQSIFDAASEEGVDIIGVSTHNGQSLGLAKQLNEMMKDRKGEYTVFMGGVLNTILPGNSEPSDVTDLIRKEGVFASNDMKEIIDMIKEI